MAKCNKSNAVRIAGNIGTDHGVKTMAISAMTGLKRLLTILVTSLLLTQCSEKPDPKTTNNTSKTTLTNLQANEVARSYFRFAKNYQIIDVDDYSVDGRKRIRVSITAEGAQDHNALIGTAIAATKKMMSKYRPQQIQIFIEPNETLAKQGYPLAIATYTPDGKGHAGDKFDGVYWEAKAVKQHYLPIEVKATEIWLSHKDKFTQANGSIDKQALDQFIADRLLINADNVRLIKPNYIAVPFQ